MPKVGIISSIWPWARTSSRSSKRCLKLAFKGTQSGRPRKWVVKLATAGEGEVESDLEQVSGLRRVPRLPQ